MDEVVEEDTIVEAVEEEDSIAKQICLKLPVSGVIKPDTLHRDVQIDC